MKKTRIARFCPLCGTALEMHERFRQLRPICPACGHIVFFAPNVAVMVLIVEDEKVLLVKRANEPKKGMWVCPAGFMEWDEDPQAAAIREVQEETGLTVQITRLLEVFHTPDDGGLADIVIAYAASVTSGTPVAADDAEALGWFDRSDIPPLAFLPTQQVVQAWAAGDLTI